MNCDFWRENSIDFIRIDNKYNFFHENETFWDNFQTMCNSLAISKANQYFSVFLWMSDFSPTIFSHVSIAKSIGQQLLLKSVPDFW